MATNTNSQNQNSVIRRVDKIHKEHPWIFTILSWLVYGGLALGISLTGLKDIPTHIKIIKDKVTFLENSLRNTTNGGLPIIVGVNTHELKENQVFVYTDNKHKLNSGDKLYLTHYTDNTFQSTITVIVAKRIKRTEKDKTSAELFISEEAALRLGIKDFRKIGVIELKFQNTDPEKQNVNLDLEIKEK